MAAVELLLPINMYGCSPVKPEEVANATALVGISLPLSRLIALTEAMPPPLQTPIPPLQSIEVGLALIVTGNMTVAYSVVVDPEPTNPAPNLP